MKNLLIILITMFLSFPCIGQEKHKITVDSNSYPLDYKLTPDDKNLPLVDMKIGDKEIEGKGVIAIVGGVMLAQIYMFERKPINRAINNTLKKIFRR